MSRPVARSEAFTEFCSWFMAEKGIGCVPTMWDLMRALQGAIPEPDSYSGEYIEIKIEPNPLVDIHWRHYSVDALRQTMAGSADGMMIPVFELSQVFVSDDGSIAGRAAVLPYLLRCYSAFAAMEAQ